MGAITSISESVTSLVQANKSISESITTLGQAGSSWDWSTLSPALLGGVLALAGSFSATWLSHRNQEKVRKFELKRKRYNSAMFAQFALAVRFQNIHSIITRQLDPHRKKGGKRFYNLLPFGVHNKVPTIPIESLSFMLKGQSANLLNSIVVADQHHETLIIAIEQRNDVHRSMQDRIMAKLGGRTDNLTDESLIALADDATKTILNDMTNSLYENSALASIHLKKTTDELEEYIREAFPGEEALSVTLTPPEDSEINQNPTQPPPSHAAE